jgi:hypothetical protein
MKPPSLKYFVLIVLFFLDMNSFAQKRKFEDQVFKISDFRVVQNSQNGSIQGIRVDFSSTSTYGKNEFNPKDAALKYYFYLKITSGNEVIYSPRDNPSLFPGKTGTTTAYVIQSDASRDYSFFIPYNKIARGECKNTLTFNIMACDEDEKHFINKIFSKQATIALPEIWVNRLEIQNMKMWTGRSYDFSLIGPGYPDVFWQIMVDRDIIYQTSAGNDSYSAYNGSKVFNTLKGEEVSLKVWDEDVVFHDKLGEYIISESLSSEPINIKQKKISFGYVDQALLSYSKSLKSKPPVITAKKVKISYDVKKDGISGVSVKLDYSADNIYVNHDVDIHAYTEAKGIRTEISWTKYSFQPPKSDPFAITFENPADSAILFFPYCELKGNEVINFEFRDELTGKLIAQTNNSVPIEIQETQDAVYSQPLYNEVSCNGIKGIQISLKQNIPAAYIQNYKGDIKQRIEITSLNKKNNFCGIIHDSIFSDSNSFFIPWSGFSNPTKAENFTDIQIKRNIYLFNSSTNSSLGKSDETIHLNVPPLFGISFNEVKVWFRKKPTGSYYFGLVHGTDTTLMNEGVFHGKKAIFGINTNLTVYHPEDEIQLILIHPDFPAENILLLNCKGIELNTKNGVILKQEKTSIVKYSLGFNIKSMNN